MNLDNWDNFQRTAPVDHYKISSAEAQIYT